MAANPDDMDEKYNRPAPRGVEIRPEHMALQSVSSGFPQRPKHDNGAPVTCKDLPPQAGVRFSVLSNSFPVRLIFPNDQIAKYDVTFEPALPEDASMERQRIIRSIRSVVEDQYGQIYLDNTRVYALNIVQDDMSFNTPAGGRVTFRLGQTYTPTEMDPQTQVQVSSIMLQRILRDSNLLRLGRAHFEQQDQWRTVQVNTEGFCNLKLWPGYRISIEPAMSGLRLSVDVCHRVLETRSVRQFMDARWDQLYSMHNTNKTMTEDRFNDIFRKNVKDELIGRAVLTLYNKRVWRVDDIDFSQKITDQFEQSDGNKITYKDYVKQRYNVDASSDYEGLLVNLPKMRKMDQGNQRQVFIIPELAYLTGYSKAMRSNRRLMKQVSDQTRVPAATRWAMAESVIKRLNQVAQDQQTPLQIAAKAKPVDGRILPAYKIYLRKGNNCDVTGPKDLQRNWARSDFMEQGAPLQKWAVVYEGNGGQGNARKMVDGLREQAKRAKLPAAAFNANPMMVPIEMRRNVPQDKCWENSIRHNVIARHPDIQAIFAVIPARANDKQSEDIYSAIKRVCSVQAGVLTQCVKGGNCGNKHVINGIFKQMFIKLGSIPWKVQFDLPGKCLDINVPTMLVGMDANHDRKQKLTSVAMVASYDRDFVRYHTNVAYQQLGQEIIDHVEHMFTAAMENFRKVNTVYPKQVIIYRDGVSNTQLEAVAKDEIRPIRNALRKLKADTKFEFIVVQKRIVARFINESNKETVHPGTIISDTVTSSQFWDFFLVPCSPPPGCTATPTRFIVVEDGLELANKRGMVDLEAFTNQLCALYFNWPGSIRVPACVKYAYKLSQQFSQAMHSRGTPASKLLLTYHFL